MTGTASQALFDLDAEGELTPPIFQPSGHGVALTPYGRHEGLGPGVFGHPFCDKALYGSLTFGNHRTWIYHLCSRTQQHEQHKCDRCEVTW